MAAVGKMLFTNDFPDDYTGLLTTALAAFAALGNYAHKRYVNYQVTKDGTQSMGTGDTGF